MGAVTPPRAAILAVDGGNSKTDAALIAGDGSLLAFARGPGSCHQVIGIDATMDILRELVTQLATDAALDPRQPIADHGGFYLAGADLPTEIDLLSGHIASEGWTSTVAVDNDTFALLRVGTESRDAVAVVCGAGINCVGVSATGGVARFPSLGRLSGDWGGGAQLGGDALWYAVRAEDGRGRPTALQDAVRRHFDLPTVAAISAGMHLGHIDPGRLHELVPVLLAVASDGDEVARSVVIRLAEEVVTLAVVALGRLKLLESPAEVVLGGGVLAARNPFLVEAIATRMQERAPRAVIRIVDEPPVTGAALLGLDTWLAPATLRDHLRQELHARAAAERGRTSP
jgi:N-acetylglucosamine kinase-like BadF-type ATPase